MLAPSCVCIAVVNCARVIIFAIRIAMTSALGGIDGFVHALSCLLITVILSAWVHIITYHRMVFACRSIRVTYIGRARIVVIAQWNILTPDNFVACIHGARVVITACHWRVHTSRWLYT